MLDLHVKVSTTNSLSCILGQGTIREENNSAAINHLES